MKKRKSLVVSLVLCLMMVFTAACGNNGGATSSSNASNASSTTAANNEAPAEVTSETDGINWEERKEKNKAIGKIRTMTSFNYSANIANTNAWVAKEQGFFEELGLDVEVLPGLSADVQKLLSVGQLQLGHIGSASELIQSISNNAPITGILAMAPVGLNVLMTLEESGITTAKDLEGKMIGYKGAMPANILAMLKKEGVDLSTIEQVSVGFDPTILKTTEIDALTGFLSNEPNTLNSLGYPVNIINPEDYGVHSSFGIVGANNDFAAKHPEAVEDYLRALLKAHEWILANKAETIELLNELSQGSFNVEVESNRLEVETNLIAENKHAGKGLGWFSDEQWQSEIDILKDAGVLTGELSVDKVADSSYVSNLYDGETLIWPTN